MTIPTKPAPSLSRAVLRGTLAALCLCAALIAIAEIGLRIRNPFQSRVRQGRVVLIANERLRIVNDVIPALDPVITVSQNSIGLRGPEPPPDLPGTLAIFTVGSSTTHCFYLSDGQTWTDKLSERLADNFSHVWVNNAGLDGDTSFAFGVLLEDYLSKFHPKAVLFLLGSGEFAFEANRETDAENIKGPILFSSPTAFLKSLSAHSELAALLAKTYRSRKHYRDGLIDEKVNLRALPLIDVPQAEQAAYFEKWAAAADLSGFRSRVEHLLLLCRAKEIMPVLITQPLLAGEGIDDVTGVDLARVESSPRHTGRMYWDLVEKYNDVTREAALRNGVPLIDLEHELPKSSRNFYDFIHFTSAGAARAAAIIGDGLCPELARRFHGYLKRSCGS